MAEIPTFDPSLHMASSLTRAFLGQPIGIGTENPAKVGAVRGAFESLRAALLTSPRTSVDLARIEIRPLAVSSGVPEQPVGFDEIVSGARNRARAAFDSGDCVLGVGLEDGLVALPMAGDGGDAGGEATFNIGCAWITDGEREGSGFSSAFSYPPECASPAFTDRAPIGDLFDALWRQHRDPDQSASSGRNEGNIGKLTGGGLTRSLYGSHSVVCALIRFLHRDLYD